MGFKGNMTSVLPSDGPVVNGKEGLSECKAQAVNSTHGYLLATLCSDLLALTSRI